MVVIAVAATSFSLWSSTLARKGEGYGAQPQGHRPWSWRDPGGARQCTQWRVTGRLQPDSQAYPGDGSGEGGRRASERVIGEGGLGKSEEGGARAPDDRNNAGRWAPISSPRKDAAGPRPLAATAA
jgi:hypothetical protein